MAPPPSEVAVRGEVGGDGGGLYIGMTKTKASAAPIVALQMSLLLNAQTARDLGRDCGLSEPI
jgi:hypothetical protein